LRQTLRFGPNVTRATMKRFGVLTALLVRRCGGILALVLALTATLDSSAAQPTYPTRTVRIAIGFAAGTPPDIAARVVADRLSQLWGQPVIIENVIGASGNLAAERVVRSEPDGHSLLIAADAGIVINPSLFRSMSFDPVRDLTPVTIVYSYPNVLVVNKELGVQNVQHLVALARTKPGTLAYGSAGPGTSMHLAGEMLKAMAGIDINHVPYRGGNGLLADLLAGRIQFYFGPTTNALEQARFGTLNALAVTSSERFPLAPTLPTMKEAGFPEFDMTVWWGLMAPAKTPAKIVEKLHRDIVAVLALPDIRARFATIGIQPVGNTPEEFSAAIEDALPKWSKLVKETGIRVD
jgi:tripartite-type tricarboxylate transporter receptor subunit TctC